MPGRSPVANKQLSAEQIGVKVGKVLGKYKMGKHFELTIRHGVFTYKRNEAGIQREADLDGMYVIRTSEPEERLSAEQAVRGYKDLTRMEQLFRSLKGLEILVRPIRHRQEHRVRAHIFICMLAYYVEWHMRRALASLLFDEAAAGAQRALRDPVSACQGFGVGEKEKKHPPDPRGATDTKF